VAEYTFDIPDLSLRLADGETIACRCPARVLRTYGSTTARTLHVFSRRWGFLYSAVRVVATRSALLMGFYIVFFFFSFRALLFMT
jgi:hypothetical protein